MRGSRKFFSEGSNFLFPNITKMAFRWRADDGPTLNAGLVDL